MFKSCYYRFFRISGKRSLIGRFFSGPAGFRRTLLAYTLRSMPVGPPLGPAPWPFRTNEIGVHGVIADVAGNVALHPAHSCSLIRPARASLQPDSRSLLSFRVSHAKARPHHPPPFPIPPKTSIPKVLTSPLVQPALHLHLSAHHPTVLFSHIRAI